MRWPFMLTSVAEAQVKGLTALIEAKDGTISAIRKDRDLYKHSAAFQKARGDGLKKLLDDAHATIADMQARLDALTPARDPVTKRFVGKAVSNG